MAAQDTVYHESTWGSVVTQLQQNADVTQGLKSAVLDAVATVNESLNPMSNCHKGYIHALICTHPTHSFIVIEDQRQIDVLGRNVENV